MDELNPNYGKSRIHFKSQCYYCCYCDLLAPTNRFQTQQVEKYLAVEPGMAEWQKQIDQLKKPGEVAICMAYRQIIHKHCLKVISTDTTILQELKERNPNNRYILKRSPQLLVIPRLDSIPRGSECIRCESFFRNDYLGFAFSHQAKTHYVHADCYQIMEDYQKKEEESKKSTLL